MVFCFIYVFFSYRFDDGTPATISQMAKDVTHFLAWTAEPEYVILFCFFCFIHFVFICRHDERKKFGLKNFIVVGFMALATLYWKRQKWSSIKSRKIKFF